MDAEVPAIPLSGAFKRVLHRLLAIGENRLHLLIAEIEEEREVLLEKFFMALAVAALALLGIMAWSAAVVFLFWEASPVVTLGILGAFYLLVAGILAFKLMGRRGMPILPATLDQLQKDRACMK